MADPQTPPPPAGRTADGAGPRSRLYGLGVRLALVLPALALLGLLFAGSAPNRSAAAPEAAAVTLTLQPTDRHRKVARLVGEVVERSHYRQATMDDVLSSQVFDRYLESLDGSRSYFLASDVAELERYRRQLDDAIRTGGVEPAFVIFERFQQRNREVLRAALKGLESEPDFAMQESFAFDREGAAWPATAPERDELWRKRVKNDAISLLLAGKTWPEAREVLTKRYERVLKRVDQVTADDVFENFMNAYAHVFDPHSNYLSPRTSEDYNIAMRLSYVGIGATLQLVDDHVTVMNVIPGGPAAVSGLLKASDRITAVGQGRDGELVDVVGWRLDDVVQLIRGPSGTVVRLSILPSGATPGTKENLLEFERNKVTLEAQAAQKKVSTVQRDGRDLRVGVIEVPSFYQDYDARVSGEKDFRSTTRDVSRLIGELKREGVDGVVVDLRGNGGGHLSEATGLVGLFVRGGPVVQLRETGGKIEVLDDPEPGEVWEGPLVVLVDRSSASASEIFAAAIQDYGRGIVVGQQTYGKGTVQNLYPLDRWALGPNAGFGQLTVTIGKYYRITGDSVQNRGVVPEITLPSLISTTEVGESTRDSALPWDRIRPVEFDADRGLAAAVAVLARRHEARMAADADLKALQADAVSFEAQRARKTVSLNLDERRAERERLEGERLTRINARRAADGQPVLKTLEELDPETEPDANLDEAAQIAADLTALAASGAVRLSQTRVDGGG